MEAVRRNYRDKPDTMEGFRMQNRWGMILAATAALGATTVVSACSDDPGTGPMFGDLEFTPSFDNIGSARETELTLRNAGDTGLGTILVGLDVLFQTTMPDSLCSSIAVLIAPSSIGSLAPGGEATIDVDIDTSGAMPDDCPPAQYDADIFASAGGTILGGATVRFDWSGTPP